MKYTADLQKKSRNQNNSELGQSIVEDSILEKLLESRILFLSGDINEQKSHEVISRLITLDYQNPSKDILLYIDSYGGDVYSLIAIHDTIKMLRCDVATVCVGKAMSAAAILLMSGTFGKRFITPNSRVMLHEISSYGEEGKLTYIRDALKETEKLQSLLEGFVKKYTKMSVKQIKDAFSKDFYMDAIQSKKFGVVDQLIDNPDIVHDTVKA
ncbi:MAG: ATP-dependent Clp protease proteolytic subunit [Saprospiraceae bacterium]